MSHFEYYNIFLNEKQLNIVEFYVTINTTKKEMSDNIDQNNVRMPR